MPERSLEELEAEAVHTGSSFRRWAFKVIGSDKAVATARSQVSRLPDFVTMDCLLVKVAPGGQAINLPVLQR